MVAAVATVATLVPAQTAVAAPPSSAPSVLSAPSEPPAALLPIAQDAQDALAYSFAMVAAAPDAGYRDGTIEAELAAGFRGLPDDQRQNFAARGAALVAAPAEERLAHFGRHGKYTVDQYRALGFDGVFTPETVPGDPGAVRETIFGIADAIKVNYNRDLARATDIAVEGGYGPIAQVPMLKNLSLYLERVDCVDETNPEWAGHDEISVGGLKIDNTGETTKIDPYYVGGGFDDGDATDYGNPGHAFASFDLTTAGAWGRTFVVTTFLAEVDNGGFANALNAAWSQAKSKVQQVVAQWVGGVASELIGAALGQALGQIVGWLVGAFVGWVINLFNDDLFAPVTMTVTLPTRFAFMYDNPAFHGWSGRRLPSATLNFSGHGGQYTTRMHWQVSA
jgi:hypothetical protein